MRNINIHPIEKSRIGEVDLDHLVFGQTFSDHMLVADFENGAWSNVEILPYGNFSVAPSMSSLHYGQAIFEGLKAFKFYNGQVSLFRPDENYQRFNRSAVRLQMPEVPEEIFMDGLRQLIALDKNWVPAKEGYALYIRPFMFATEAALGVHPSVSYRFAIITSPVGVYYSKALRLKVETHYARAAKGGVGFSKNAGNYALSLYPTRLAHEEGYDQLIWTDAQEHKYIEEVGTANLIFVKNGTVITPGSETVLQGITRRSIIAIAKYWGYPTETRDVSVEELLTGIEDGSVTEAFAAGTAVTVSPIAEIGFEDKAYYIPLPSEDAFSSKITSFLTDLRYGKAADPFGWNHLID